MDKKRGNLLYHLATRSVSTSPYPLSVDLAYIEPLDQGGGTVTCVLLSRFKGSQEWSGLLVVYVCDERIRTEQQLTGECVLVPLAVC